MIVNTNIGNKLVKHQVYLENRRSKLRIGKGLSLEYLTKGFQSDFLFRNPAYTQSHKLHENGKSKYSFLMRKL